jgi:Zn-dependent M28 family amino/carboxypeptidase
MKSTNQKPKLITLLTITLPIVIFLLILPNFKSDLKSKPIIQSDREGGLKMKREVVFNGERAMRDVDRQVAFGPRIPGTIGHKRTINWLFELLKKFGWETILQEGSAQGHSITNIIAKKGDGKPWVLIGAHYDSRIHADEDKKFENRDLPVPGANDGASGVAVLLELARILPQDIPFEIWLVFFDAEDNGNIDGWDWIIGSRFFVSKLQRYPDSMILVDMIGDKDLNIYMEKNSDTPLKNDVWSHAANLGYSEYFIPINKYSLIDDHIPFLEAGIPAINIIDFDYPYYHTVEDTSDKISHHSLQIVGDTLLSWLFSLTQ